MSLSQNMQTMSQHLRFLLFEIGIGLSQNSMVFYLDAAEKEIAAHLNPMYPLSKQHLEKAIAFHALSLAYKARWQWQLKNGMEKQHNFWNDYLFQQSAQKTLLFLEQWQHDARFLIENLPKSCDLSAREYLQYAPQFQARTLIHWCALKKSCFPSQIDEIQQWEQALAEAFPKAYQLWQESLFFMRIDAADYFPLPMHPWQWRHKLSKIMDACLEKKSLILIPHHQALFPSTSPFQMMSEVSGLNQLKFHPLTPEKSAPLKSSPTFEITLDKETAFRVDLITHRSLPQAKAEFILPVSSLFALSPYQNKPLLIELINSSGLSPMEFFMQYGALLRQCCSQLPSIDHSFNTKNTLLLLNNRIPVQLYFREDAERCEQKSGDAFLMPSGLGAHLKSWIQILCNEFKLDETLLIAAIEKRMSCHFDLKMNEKEHLLKNYHRKSA